MKKQNVNIIICCLFLLNWCGIAECNLILQPSAVSTDMGEYFPASHVIDQSGLTPGYTNLVSDFDVYIASNPTAYHGHGENTWGALEKGIRSGHFDFDLGGSYVIDAFVIWNLVDDPSAIREFNLLADSSSDFSNPVNLGSFTALNNLGLNWNTEAQVFNFHATEASYVRLDILNTWSPTSWHVAYNEAAFSVVPEPTTLLLFGLGGLVLRKRRK